MEKILTQAEVCELLRIKPGALYRWRKSGDFPESIGVGALRWTEQQIIEWLNRKSAPVPDVTNHATKRKQQDKDRKRRIQAARLSLERHKKTK